MLRKAWAVLLVLGELAFLIAVLNHGRDGFEKVVLASIAACYVSIRARSVRALDLHTLVCIDDASQV